MPSEKRARKRAQREAKLAALEKQRRRRASIRRTVTIIVLAAIAVGIYFAVSSGKKKGPVQATSDSQAAVDAVAVKAGCPSDPKTSLDSLPTSDRASHKDLTWSQPPAETIDASKTYLATVKTDVGSFTISLQPSDSPTGVNNFVFLAQHKFFDCVTFHRVIPGFVVQGGDPTGTGTGGPGYQFTASGPPKAANPSQQYPIGSVAMANSSQQGDTNPSTNGSQFFIITGTQGEQLPPDYVLLGQVTSGMSVVNKISGDGTSSGTPTIVHRMLSVTVSQA